MSSTTLPAAEHSLRLRLAGGVGLTGIVLIFLLGLRSPTAMYLGMFLVLVALVVAADRALPVLLREPLFWLVLVLFAWVFLRGWVDLATAEARGMEPDDRAVWHHARFTPLLPLLFALWVAAWWRYRYILLLLIGLSMVAYMIDNWDRLLYGLPGGGRPFASAFGEAGIMAATVLFLVVAATIGCWRTGRNWHPGLRWSATALGVALAAFALFVFLAAQARAAWLAMLGTLAVFAVVGAWYLWRYAGPRQRRLALAVSGGGLAVFIVAAIASWDILSNRLLQDTETIAVLLSGDVEQEDVPGGSFGDRYRMFRQGLIDIRENPLWGVGPGSVRDMLHEIWGKDRGGSGNYHSTWLNLLVAMGIPWTLLWVGTHVWAIARAARELIVTDREAFLAVALVGAAMVHFGTLTFQGARLWSVQGSALYLVLMTLVCAVLLRAAVRRQGLASTASPG